MQALITLVGISIVFWILRAVYRLYFHPLSLYPGSPYAAVSKSWYEWYWNFHQKGMLLFEIERLHQKLGPIVRIAPNELHINDPEIFQDMTKVGSHFTKDPSFYDYVVFPGTSVGESDPAKHRARRLVLTPAFSPARLQQLAPMVKEKVDLLLDRFKDLAANGAPINITTSSKAFAMDIISKIVFGKELDCLRDPNFRNQFIEYLHSTFDMGWTAPSFPLMTKFSLSLPEYVSETLFPIPIMEFKKKCRHIINNYLRDRNVPVEGETNEMLKKEDFNSSIVIDMLVDPNSAKEHKVLNASQLAEEVIMLLSAGNDTVSDVIIVGIYQILRNAAIYKKLNDELAAAIPDLKAEITYDKVKTLPYLTAVIKEALRYSNPLPGRAPRRVPPEGYNLYGHHLPRGTVLITSAYLLNRHPDIWEHADDFQPDRWLREGSSHLDKYMVSFYRGTRQCLGRDLALCELYTLFANLFRRFELEIYDTTDDDMKWIDLLLTFFTGKNFQAKMKNREK